MNSEQNDTAAPSVHCSLISDLRLTSGEPAPTVLPPRSDRISRVPPYSWTQKKRYPYGAVTRSGASFQMLQVLFFRAAGLVRFRSPLLSESLLMSFPPATEMFQFAGFAFDPL